MKRKSTLQLKHREEMLLEILRDFVKEGSLGASNPNQLRVGFDGTPLLTGD
jgi:hypothetical protein